MAYLSLLFFGFYEKKKTDAREFCGGNVFFWGEVRAKTQSREVFLRSSHGDTEPQSFY